MTDDLIAAGYAARRARDLPSALQYFAQAGEFAQQSGDRTLLAQALIGAGQIRRDLGQIADAQRLYEEARAIVRGTGELLWLAHTVRHVGDMQLELGAPASAEASFAEALTIYRADAATPPLDLANALRGYALVREELGDTPGAAALWREAREIYAALDVQAGVSESSRRLAALDAREPTSEVC